MRVSGGKSILLFLILAVAASSVSAKDMRKMSLEAEETRKMLMEKAIKEKEEAEKEKKECLERIAKDKKALEREIRNLEKENADIENEVQEMTEALPGLMEKDKEMARKLAETDSMIRELAGVIRVNARELDELVSRNLQTALQEKPPSFLAEISDENRFPGMGDIRNMVVALKKEIITSGHVYLTRGKMVDRTGKEVDASILVLGPFTAAYRLGEETGFLNYSSSGNTLYALSRLPSKRIRGQIGKYMDAGARSVPIDISRGAALRQLTHELRLWEQIPKGGPIVWPILIIFALGVLIILERVFFLLRKRFAADKVMDEIEKLSFQNNWDACIQRVEKHRKKPVAKVMRAGLDTCHMQREEMENALQEAILREIPKMERFLSTLGMLAAIAPLLGLLGTVTGMIDTFHVITLHGTGDPRLMSGGISEALVTTMLGLSVAIPLMISHTLLNRAVDRQIGEMEEKGVALVNIIHKSRKAG